MKNTKPLRLVFLFCPRGKTCARSLEFEENHPFDRRDLLMKFTAAVALTAALAMSACTTTEAVPVVSSFNGDSVGLQGPGFFGTEKPTQAFVDEANRLCGRRGMKAEYASSRMVADYTQEHLYLCV